MNAATVLPTAHEGIQVAALLDCELWISMRGSRGDVSLYHAPSRQQIIFVVLDDIRAQSRVGKDCDCIWFGDAAISLPFAELLQVADMLGLAIPANANTEVAES